MKALTLKERFSHLDRMIKANKIIRNRWTDEQERACLLAALSPEAGEQESASACPASVLPRWFAELTPAMDDSGSLESWPAFVKRYADVVRRASETLDVDGWHRAEYRVRSLAVAEAMKHTDDAPALAACSVVVKMWQKVVDGGEVGEEERSAAKSAAWSAAKSAAKSAAWSAAKSAAESAAWSAAWSAAKSAAWSAAESAARSAARSAAESAAKSAAWSAAWDRMNDAILDALEAEINRSKKVKKDNK